MVDVHLDLRQPQSHRLTVRLLLQPRQRHLRLRLPAWTPGSYLIRDYVRQLESLQVLQAGVALPVRRLEPATWQLELNAEQEPSLITIGRRRRIERGRTRGGAVCRKHTNVKKNRTNYQ